VVQRLRQKAEFKRASLVHTGFEYLRRKRELPTVPGFDIEYLPCMVPIICHVSFTNMAGNMPR
jgi:hypothetical protein